MKEKISGYCQKHLSEHIEAPQDNQSEEKKYIDRIHNQLIDNLKLTSRPILETPQDNWEEEWKSLQNKFYPGDRMNYLTTEQVADIDQLLGAQKKENDREWREKITNSLTPHEYVSDDPKIERIVQDEKLKKLKALLK